MRRSYDANDAEETHADAGSAMAFALRDHQAESPIFGNSVHVPGVSSERRIVAPSLERGERRLLHPLVACP